MKRAKAFIIIGLGLIVIIVGSVFILPFARGEREFRILEQNPPVGEWVGRDTDNDEDSDLEARIAERRDNLPSKTPEEIGVTRETMLDLIQYIRDNPIEGSPSTEAIREMDEQRAGAATGQIDHDVPTSMADPQETQVERSEFNLTIRGRTDQVRELTTSDEIFLKEAEEHLYWVGFHIAQELVSTGQVTASGSMVTTSYFINGDESFVLWAVWDSEYELYSFRIDIL